MFIRPHRKRSSPSILVGELWLFNGVPVLVTRLSHSGTTRAGRNVFDTFIHATEVRRVDAAIMSGNIIDAQARVAHQLLSHLDDVEVLELDNVVTGEHRDKGSQLRRPT